VPDHLFIDPALAAYSHSLSVGSLKPFVPLISDTLADVIDFSLSFANLQGLLENFGEDTRSNFSSLADPK
jgi:hypothetical protein